MISNNDDTFSILFANILLYLDAILTSYSSHFSQHDNLVKLNVPKDSNIIYKYLHNSNKLFTI